MERLLTFSVNKNSYDKIDKIAKLIVRVESSNYKTKEWITDAFLNIVEGKRDIENINPTSFAIMCEKTAQLQRAKSPEQPIITMEEFVKGYKGITEIVAEYIEESLDGLLEEIDEDYYVDRFLIERERIYKSEGKDIWRLLELSKMDDKKSLKDLREIIELFDIGELIEYVIRRPSCYNRLGGILC